MGIDFYHVAGVVSNIYFFIGQVYDDVEKKETNCEESHKPEEILKKTGKYSL